MPRLASAEDPGQRSPSLVPRHGMPTSDSLRHGGTSKRIVRPAPARRRGAHRRRRRMIANIASLPIHGSSARSTERHIPNDQAGIRLRREMPPETR